MKGFSGFRKKNPKSAFKQNTDDNIPVDTPADVSIVNELNEGEDRKDSEGNYIRVEPHSNPNRAGYSKWHDHPEQYPTITTNEETGEKEYSHLASFQLTRKGYEDWQGNAVSVDIKEDTPTNAGGFKLKFKNKQKGPGDNDLIKEMKAMDGSYIIKNAGGVDNMTMDQKKHYIRHELLYRIANQTKTGKDLDLRFHGYDFSGYAFNKKTGRYGTSWLSNDPSITDWDSVSIHSPNMKEILRDIGLNEYPGGQTAFTEDLIAHAQRIEERHGEAPVSMQDVDVGVTTGKTPDGPGTIKGVTVGPDSLNEKKDDGKDKDEKRKNQKLLEEARKKIIEEERRKRQADLRRKKKEKGKKGREKWASEEKYVPQTQRKKIIDIDSLGEKTKEKLDDIFGGV